MQDLALNSDFSVHLDDRNDLASVSGREAFEQALVVRLTDLMHGAIRGLTNGDTVEERINLTVSRVAREMDFIDSIANVNVTPSPNDPNTYLVQITYTSDEIFEREVSL